jgi:hypothetical protein
MAEPGEWSAKGATLSDATALKEYGVKLDFIVRSQLEKYILSQLGNDYLETQKAQTELRKIKSEMTALTKNLNSLKSRRLTLETFISKNVKNDTLT